MTVVHTGHMDHHALSKSGTQVTVSCQNRTETLSELQTDMEKRKDEGRGGEAGAQGHL